MTELEVFYNGSCSFCRAVKKYIEKKAPEDKIMFTDISEDTFMPELYEDDVDDFYSEIVAEKPLGLIIRGPDVPREIIKILGYKKTYRLINFPITRNIFNFVCRIFSRMSGFLSKFI